MKLSDQGLRAIQGYEGFHDRLPDGRCRAYQRQYKGKLDIPTIGYGCTEGVKPGMIWTEAEADAAFAKELEKFERGVMRLVKVDINQNEFDALVSFSYNCGLSALEGSTILRRLNACDRAGAAAAFGLWNKVAGHEVRGLTARRAYEAAMFLKPVRPMAGPDMPQTVDAPSSTPASMAHSTEGQMAVTTGGGGVVTTGQGVQSAAIKTAQGGDFTVKAFLINLIAEPLFWAGLTAILGAAYWYFKRRRNLYLHGI